jgi:hypothetical protein
MDVYLFLFLFKNLSCQYLAIGVKIMNIEKKNARKPSIPFISRISSKSKINAPSITNNTRNEK